MTTTEVITSARRLLADDLVPYRWTDTALVQYINDGVREIVRRLPHLLLSALHAIELVDDKDPGETILIQANYRMALAYYVASCALREDSSDKVNMDLAETYYSNYMRSLS